MAVPKWLPQWNSTATSNTTTLYVCASCNAHSRAGVPHFCGPNGGLTIYRPHITKLTITGTAVILEDEYGNGLEIALDVLRRLMNFSEIEAFAALDALRR